MMVIGSLLFATALSPVSAGPGKGVEQVPTYYAVSLHASFLQLDAIAIKMLDKVEHHIIGQLLRFAVGL
jgi:hypothetical protein